jgi:hypothetical protein
LDEAAARLVQGHPDSADTIHSKQEEIHDEWTQLTAKANARKEKLLDSYDLQRFLSDYRDLTAWIQSMMGLVASDELASDVTGAEALLERHQVCDLFAFLELSRVQFCFKNKQVLLIKLGFLELSERNRCPLRYSAGQSGMLRLGSKELLHPSNTTFCLSVPFFTCELMHDIVVVINKHFRANRKSESIPQLTQLVIR